jgi:hypothetical protein
MLTADYIVSKQLDWAVHEGITLERYTKTVEDNIFGHVLHPETQKEYQRGKGHELEGKRAHMKALHSSSALVVNVFDYWRRENRIEEIANSCEAQGTMTTMEFEKTHSIKAVTRTPPHLDVEFNGQVPLAIESKFTETYHRKTRRDDDDTHLEYYLAQDSIWYGLQKTKGLSMKIKQQSGSRTDFEYLDVPQLIKHILGLTCSSYDKFTLLYLWYRIDSDEAIRHEKELTEFSSAVKDDGIDFRVMTYQDLFGELKKIPNVGSDYLDYLNRRYFSLL